MEGHEGLCWWTGALAVMPDSQKNLGEHPTAAVSHVTLFVKGFIVRQQLQVVRGTQQCIILHVDIFPSEVERFSHHTAHAELFFSPGRQTATMWLFWTIASHFWYLRDIWWHEQNGFFTFFPQISKRPNTMNTYHRRNQMQVCIVAGLLAQLPAHAF